MSKYVKKPINETPEQQLAAAQAWRGKLVLDAYEKRLGMVSTVVLAEDGETLMLVARFQGETADRRIALALRPDWECLVPDQPRCRYRTASKDDLAAVKAAQAARQSAGR